MKLKKIQLLAITVYIFTMGIVAEEINSNSIAEYSRQKYASSIYQIRIINSDSENKNSLGTGFLINDGRLLATNYHVISSVVLEPNEDYAVISINGTDQKLEVIAIDVIHDLAILRRVEVDNDQLEETPPMKLSQKAPSLGAKLYSIGNPFDIGMTIVEGNYNGLVDDRFFDQIHFSGAINPGMSGGPTINSDGEVVGINVASAGNQVGFLVPVDKLVNLVESIDDELDSPTKKDLLITNSKIKTTKLQQSIGTQIQKATHSMLEQILSNTWPKQELGSAMVVGKMHDAVNCWGESDTDTKTKITYIKKSCNTRDSMFISQKLRSGFIEYAFTFREVTDWPSSSFYTQIGKYFLFSRLGNRAGPTDVDNFKCIEEIVHRDQESIKRKIVYCTRPYIIFPELFDTFYLAVSIDKDSEVIMERFTLSGVNKMDAELFLNRFITEVSWK
ncbi:MAG: trypsin-like peptidase domain-containing protein [Gammaproteobacteria bacterium]|nr:trypsin-like peptidase domain-containing protein [Gammaproteobacteria bacterium]